MNLLEKPYWKPYPAISLSLLEPKIRDYYSYIKKFVEDGDNQDILDKFAEEQQISFIENPKRYPELSTSNSPQKGLNEDAENVHNQDSRVQQRYRKNLNLANVLQILFGTSLLVDKLPSNQPIIFDITLLHNIVNKLFDDNTACTKYRTDANPIPGYHHALLPPNGMPELIGNFFNEYPQPLERDVSNWYEKAGIFFADFLYIRPYPDGNGRLARIFLSLYLINYTIVPLSLFSWRSGSDDIYMQCLEFAHKDKELKHLIFLIVESVFYNLEHCYKEINKAKCLRARPII